MMNKKLEAYIARLDIESITDSRKQVLSELTRYIAEKDLPKLNFICTHNSRRSHLTQVWAQAMGYHFDVPVATYSGGTEVTAFHPNAVAALQRAGFQVEKEQKENPRYRVQFSEQKDPLICFSKVFDDPANPSADFAAVMTCSEADSGCPVVTGADRRIRLFYEDPKVSDGTPTQDVTYDQRCLQIATEMYFVFSSLG